MGNKISVIGISVNFHIGATLDGALNFYFKEPSPVLEIEYH